MLSIYKGGSARFKYVLDKAALPDDDPLKVDGLLTTGYDLQFVVRDTVDSTTNRISKSSATASQIEIVSDVLAYVHITPTDTSAIAIPAGKKKVDMWYGFGIGNGSTYNFPIEGLRPFEVLRSLV